MLLSLYLIFMVTSADAVVAYSTVHAVLFRRGNAWECCSHCWKAAGSMGTAFPLLVFKTHYGHHCKPFSGQKMH